MGLFGGRPFRLDQGPYKLDPSKQGGSQPVRSNGGLRGAFMRKSLPRTLQVIGATLQQMDNPQGQLDQFGANEADAQRRAMEESAMARDEKYMDQAIGSLPPEQQPWARLAPDAAARGMFGPAQARYGDLERVDGRLGQRNQITGQYEWAPQTPSGMIFQPPAGYRGSAESLEPIPGGPVAAAQGEAQRGRRDRLASSASQLENALSVIGEAMPQINGLTTGAAGQMLRGVGGTGALNLEQALEPLLAIVAFENLAEMRRNSETGGALGSIAVRELDLLARTIRSLDTRQGADQLRGNMTAVQTQLSRTLQAVRAAQQELEQGPGEAPIEPNMAGEQNQQQPRVMQWSPERGVY